ncbi:MAG: AAA domain-containing protein [Chloroflexota bacterium]
MPTERELDVKVPPKETYHFLDADASQLEALTAASRGADLIIQGPPGTGKSQTIANLIAEALAQNKKVLFVSEKMAALDVVFRRLAAHGLDTLCLELHSHQANKRAVLDQLARGLAAVDPGPPDATRLMDLQQLTLNRQRLNEYVDALHGNDNPLGISPFTAQAQAAALATAPDATYRLTAIADLRHEQLAELLELIAQLKAVGHVLLNQDSNPWRDSTVPEASLDTQGVIGTRLRRLLDALGRARHIGGVFAGAWKLPAPTSVDGLRWLQQLLVLLESNPNPPATWFAEGPLTPYLATARAHAEEATDYRRRRAIILARYAESVFALPAADLRHVLTIDTEEALWPFAGSETERRTAASVARLHLNTALDAAISATNLLLTVGSTLSPRFGLPVPITAGDAQFLLQVTELLLKDPRPSPGWLNRSTLLTIQSIGE